MNWTTYLPPTLQVASVYWILAVCVAARFSFQAIPDKYRFPWVLQLSVFLVGLLMALGIVGNSMVYAAGTALICSTISVFVYDVAQPVLLSFVTSKIRAFLGAPPSPPTPIEPLQLPPKP